MTAGQEPEPDWAQLLEKIALLACLIGLYGMWASLNYPL
jgi:hypothetical protein